MVSRISFHTVVIFSVLLVAFVFIASTNGDNAGLAIRSSVQNQFTPTVNVNAPRFPVLLYTSSSYPPQNLKVLFCGNDLCSSGNTIKTLLSSTVARNARLMLFPDNTPGIVFADSQKLRFLKCDDSLCTTFSNNVIFTPSGLTSLGSDYSVVLGKDGKPFITFDTIENLNYTKGFLRAIKCGDRRCSSNNQSVIVDDAASFGFNILVGRGNSVVVPPSGNPIISYTYYNGMYGELYVATCLDSACQNSTKVLLDGLTATAGVNPYTAIALNGSNLPIVAYTHNFQAINYGLKIVECLTSNCGVYNLHDHSVSVPYAQHLRMTMTSDYLPVIIYLTNTAYPSVPHLSLFKCASTSCNAGQVSDLGALPNLNRFPDISTNDAGNPLIVFGSSPSSSTLVDLKVAVCSDLSCIAYTTSPTLDQAGLQSVLSSK